MPDAAPTSALPAPARKRRWYQFSLRTLLLFMLVIGCGTGWFGKKWREAERQRVAVEAIKAVLEGDVFYDYELQADGSYVHDKTLSLPGPAWLRKRLGIDFFATVHVVDVPGASFGKRKITDQDLVHLESLPNLKKLEISLGELTDAGLMHLQGLVELKELSLDCFAVTDAGMTNLEGLKELEQVSLLSMSITDVGLEKVAGLPKLKALVVESPKLGGNGLKSLQKIVRLESLSLSYTSITDEDLKDLRTLKNLKKLFLGWTQISDAGLQELTELSNLEMLDLEDTQIEGSGLSQLRKLTNLKFLNLGGEKFSEAGLQKLPELTQLERMYLTLEGNSFANAGLKALQDCKSLKFDLSRTSVSAETESAYLRGLTQLENLVLRDDSTFEAFKLKEKLPNCRVEFSHSPARGWVRSGWGGFPFTGIP